MNIQIWRRPKKPKRPIIGLDFDGVIHLYSSGWKGARVIPDGPVDGAIEFMFEAVQAGWDVVIHSSRARHWGGRRAMRRWLRDCAGNLWSDGPGYEGLENVRFVLFKPPAVVTIDDRALTFTGVFPSHEEIRKFKPWNK